VKPTRTSFTIGSVKSKRRRSSKDKQDFFGDAIDIKKDLQQFYNKEAKKYYETRKKYWKDVEYLLEALESFRGKKIRILEFGCGSGRFASYLLQHYQGDFDYIGVDFSQKLIDLAQKELPDFTFICSDISTFVLQQEQESFDIIVGTSSFQHIPNKKERLFLMKYFYGLLKYEGLFMMLNWAFSQRFFRTYWKQCLSSFGKWCMSF
jgi:ubiquinone/menaquinone biosynthesis C-methylase UbiE